MTVKKLLIIDGNSILNRAYYGIRMLNAPDGTPTNAVYGFLNILFKNLEEDMPDYLCVAFDVKEKTFRHKMYDLYKAQRKPAPEDFLVQIPLMKQVLEKMNCLCLEKPGYEADDIIGTVSSVCEKEGVECIILTGDKDDLQLASELVKVKLVITKMGSTTTTLFGAEEVFEKYSVTPSEFIDVKGLMGDTSDNIPGVKGIGEKTAFSLIEKYKSIQNIYDNIDTLDATPSVKKKLEEGKEEAYLSRKLSEIDRNVPLDFELEKCAVREYDREALAEMFLKLNFKSFLSKLDLNTSVKMEETKFEGQCEPAESSKLSELSETEEKVYYRFYDKGIGLTVDGENSWFVSEPKESDLKRFFEEEKCGKVGFDTKEDILRLRSIGIEYRGLSFDAAIAAYILDPTRSSYKLDDLALEHLGMALGSEQTLEDDGQFSISFDEEETKSSTMAMELFVLFKLAQQFSEEIEKNGQHRLYYDVELPLAEVLADMQYTGVFVDKNALVEFGSQLKSSISEYERLIYEYAGKTFNINSPKQLGEVLFDGLQLPHGKKTKTGYSTNAEVLKKLEGAHPIIECILEYRGLAKLQSTYVDGLIPVINNETGRIHSNFNQTVTATGRISSTEPNLQNIPTRTERGRQMRKMFVAEGEKILVDADYSQIELRVLAHIADDENMKNAFREGVDIHTQTASQVFKVPIDEVTPEMRFGAKAVNFGIVYGIGEFSLAQDLKISMKEAKQYIEDYLAAYPKVKEYMEKTVSDGRTKGYVSTILNRRRYLPELRAANRITQAFGERVAMNAPIQGSAADIIKIAMVNVYRKLKDEGLKSKLILQVHDELIVEAVPEELAAVEKLLVEEMEKAVTVSVPLKVESNSGKTWYDTK
ncbi:MAG: DNA polymerase I [Clostridia bacterium]|nr:DNA polymerase I [Clostridia bacterium]